MLSVQPSRCTAQQIWDRTILLALRIAGPLRRNMPVSVLSDGSNAIKALLHSAVAIRKEIIELQNAIHKCECLSLCIGRILPTVTFSSEGRGGWNAHPPMVALLNST